MTSQVAAGPLALPSRLSPSALARYRECPKQFLLCDIKQLSRFDEKTPQLAQGNAIHQALNLFYGLDLGYRSAENLERCLRSAWRSTTHAVFQTPEEEAAAGRASISMLRSYADNFDITAEPVARERWVGVRVAGTSLYGKIDRLDANNDKLTLIDYKTGRRAMEPEDLRHEPAVQVYVLGAEATYKLSVERVRFIYLALDRAVTWDIEREDVEALGKSLVGTLCAMHKDVEFPARPGRQCGFCPAQLHCPDKDRVAIEQVAASAKQADEELPF